MSLQPGRGYLGISEVLAQLRGDFPDVSVSKIRFLETEGLISPARSPSGYRRFCAADVETLRFILAAQRDQYLPLRVIRERLAKRDPAGGEQGGYGNGNGQRAGETRPDGRADGGERRGSQADWPGLAAGRAVGPAPASGRSGEGRTAAGQAGAGPAGPDEAARMLSRSQLVEEAGLTEALLTELETFGLLRRVGRSYGADALQVARAAVALTAYGVEARHLRAVRAAAERETTMIESLVAPIVRQRGSGARELAGRTAGELAELVLRLHGALVDGALAEAGLAPPGSGGHQGAQQDASQGQGGAAVRGVEGASA
jgi:DNA-binding transcriptional MerR regulator